MRAQDQVHEQHQSSTSYGCGRFASQTPRQIRTTENIPRPLCKSKNNRLHGFLKSFPIELCNHLKYCGSVFRTMSKWQKLKHRLQLATAYRWFLSVENDLDHMGMGIPRLSSTLAPIKVKRRSIFENPSPLRPSTVSNPQMKISQN